MTEDIFSIKNNVFVITGGMGQLGQVYTNAVLSRGGKVAILDIFDYKNSRVSALIDQSDKDNILYISIIEFNYPIKLSENSPIFIAYKNEKVESNCNLLHITENYNIYECE